MNNCHKERTYQCSMCVYKFVKQKELDSHFLRVHTDLKKEECHVCGGVFNHLKDHFKRRHTDRYRQVCNVCGDVFKDMKNHLRRTACGIGKKLEATLKCDLCFKMFTLIESLKHHIKSIHEQVKDYACKVCDYKTTTTYNLDLRTGSMHSGVKLKKQQCPHCDKMPYKLDWHISTYHSLI